MPSVASVSPYLSVSQTRPQRRTEARPTQSPTELFVAIIDILLVVVVTQLLVELVHLAERSCRRLRKQRPHTGDRGRRVVGIERWGIRIPTYTREDRTDPDKPIGIDKTQRVSPDIAVGVDASRQPDRIALHIHPPRREPTEVEALRQRRVLRCRGDEEDAAPEGQASDVVRRILAQAGARGKRCLLKR